MTTPLSFDPATHEYRLPDGRRVPSVTEILRATGVSTDFEAIGALSQTVHDAIELKRAIGSALHQDIVAFDDNDLDWSTVDPRVLPYVQAWQQFRADKPHLTPTERERIVYHAALQYAGTFDGVFFDSVTGRRILIDIKTGDADAAGARYQLCGYMLCVPAEERWAVRLLPGRTVPYQVTPYTDYRDFEVWRAIVATYYAQAARRRAA